MGRFEVSLPFNFNPKLFGSSFERRLSKDDTMRPMYHDFMKEYFNLSHISLLNKFPDNPHYFIPHQCVRVVFDASCRTSSRASLNELLMVGPIVQEELYPTLIRFRFHRYVITADTEKMCRQVMIDDKDRKFQLVL